MKKNGFTLVEVLAVIVVLSIIALIAVPTVSNIVDTSKRGAFRDSIENLTRAMEQKCLSDIYDGAIEEKEYTFTVHIHFVNVILPSPSHNVISNIPVLLKNVEILPAVVGAKITFAICDVNSKVRFPLKL